MKSQNVILNAPYKRNSLAETIPEIVQTKKKRILENCIGVRRSHLGIMANNYTKWLALTNYVHIVIELS